MPHQPGDILLDKYCIEKLLGSGAFAEVYLATHLALNAPRALKILRKDTPGLGSTEFRDFRARFQLEAQLGARLDHPNIIRVHDFEQDGETLILVMEYAQGGSLTERLARAREGGERIPIPEAVQIALDVAQGLAAIHALDAVHRDLKPSNILFDKDDRAKVADLGLAQIRGGPSLRSQLSMPAPHPGMPGYMSPEQERVSNYLTPASDVYALGLVFFETLTGRMYRSQRPGTRARDLRADVPAWLDDLLARMLAQEPEERPWDGGYVAGLLKEGVKRENVKRKEEQARREGEARAMRKAEEKTRQETLTADSRQRTATSRKAKRQKIWQRIPAWAWSVLLLLGAGVGVVLLIGSFAGGVRKTPIAAIEAIPTTSTQLALLATETPGPTQTQPPHPYTDIGANAYSDAAPHPHTNPFSRACPDADTDANAYSDVNGGHRLHLGAPGGRDGDGVRASREVPNGLVSR